MAHLSIAILGGLHKWTHFEGVSNNAIADALFLSGPAALMERIVYGTIVECGEMTFLDWGEKEYKPPKLDQTHCRAGGPIRKYSDQWQHTTFGGNILEGLWVEVGDTIEKEQPDASTSDVRSFFLNRTNHVFVPGNLGDLLSGIAEGARAGYVSAWNH